MRYGFCLPDKAQYITGENVKLTVPGNAEAVLKLTNLHSDVDCGRVTYEMGQTDFSAHISGLPEGSYGVSFEREDERWETAFDVAESRSGVTRYGFLTGFSPGDAGRDDVESMARLHINAVQFYDWMYRHDNLVSGGEIYHDALGKETSNAVILEKIAAAKEKGMRPFAYGAVYAASKECRDAHPEWGLYTLDGKPLIFGDWLYYMNISEECGWFAHILDEYARAGRELGFAGIHMDTYGFPKLAWNAEHNAVALARKFTPLINTAAVKMKNIDAANGVIFNAVNNWPVDSVAASNQDAVYIEVWPPHTDYIDLYHLIRRAKLLSGKHVVLAAYMEPFKEAKTETEICGAEVSYLIANAVICASGGTQLALGEKDCILCDSYYVKHAKLRDSFLPSVQRYADFVVRYAPLLYGDNGADVSMTDSGGINEEFIFTSGSARFSAIGKAGTVWTVIRESEKRISVQLINLKGNSQEWNSPKNKPEAITGAVLTMRLDRELSGIYAASPDCLSLASEKLNFAFENTKAGRVYKVTLPAINIWTTVWIEIKS